MAKTDSLKVTNRLVSRDTDRGSTSSSPSRGRAIASRGTQRITEEATIRTLEGALAWVPAGPATVYPSGSDSAASTFVLEFIRSRRSSSTTQGGYRRVASAFKLHRLPGCVAVAARSFKGTPSPALRAPVAR
jgi:hypothetical protein